MRPFKAKMFVVPDPIVVGSKTRTGTVAMVGNNVHPDMRGKAVVFDVLHGVQTGIYLTLDESQILAIA